MRVVREALSICETMKLVRKSEELILIRQGKNHFFFGWPSLL